MLGTEVSGRAVGGLGGWLLLALAAIMLLLLSGCGGEGRGGEGGTARATTEAEGGQRSTEGERSVEEFGLEAHAGTRAALLGTFRGYLAAIGTHRYRAACAKLSATVRESLAQLANSGRPTHSECSRVLPGLISSSAAATAREQAGARVARIRVKGDRAFVVFHAAGAKLYLMTLVDEGSGWKASMATAGVLAPSIDAVGG